MPYEKTPASQISFQGKTISVMRELAKGIFKESFISIEIYDVREKLFLVRIEDNVDDKTLKYFKDNYKQCIVKMFQEVKENQDCSKKKI